MNALAKQIWAPVLGFLALGYLVLMVVVGTHPERVHLIRYQANGVMAQKPGTITRVVITRAGKSISFARRSSSWVRGGETASVDAGLAKSISLAVKFLHTAEPVRIFKAGQVASTAAADFGLSTPTLSIKVEDAQGVVLEADFGNPSSDGLLHYMRVKGRDKIYLMSRFVLRQWQAVADQKG